jgi:hypothetical protein
LRNLHQVALQVRVGVSVSAPPDAVASKMSLFLSSMLASGWDRGSAVPSDTPGPNASNSSFDSASPKISSNIEESFGGMGLVECPEGRTNFDFSKTTPFQGQHQIRSCIFTSW